MKLMRSELCFLLTSFPGEAEVSIRLAKNYIDKKKLGDQRSRYFCIAARKRFQETDIKSVVDRFLTFL